jgi:hypothetical protein
LRLVFQDKKAEDCVKMLQYIVSEVGNENRKTDIKALESIFKWNVYQNLNATSNPDIIPFLDTFVEKDGLKYLVPLLLSEFDGLVTEVVKCFPPIFEHYVVHDYIKNHSILLLHLWSKLEDSSSLKIKQLALKSLFKLCA